jgi:hypothetical protein
MASGRPTKYTNKLADEICTLRETMSLLQLCKRDDMPVRSTIYLWLADEDKKDFSDKYAKAADTFSEKLFDELLDIADDGTNDYMEKERDDGSSFEVVNTEHIARSRLRVDTRKWYLSKVLPKKYGDKLDLTSDGEKLPTPILSLDAIRGNHSDEEGAGAK